MVEMDESDALIRQNIRSILASRRMAQAELARRAGLPTSTVSRILTGRRQASYHTVRKIAAALDLPVSHLAGDTERSWVDPDVQAFFEQKWAELPLDVKNLIRTTLYVLAENCVGKK